MKENSQITLFGLAILLILSCFTVNSDTAKTTTSQVTYGYYYLLIGLVYAYRGKIFMARKLLHRVAINAENNDYRKAAEELLKNLPHQ